jgi:hypothetical protein
MGESDGVAAGVTDSAMSEDINGPTFGFNSEEIADLRKEFDAANVGGTGVLNKAQLIDLLFKRLFYSRPDNVGNKVDRILQRTAYLQTKSTAGSTEVVLSGLGSAQDTAKNQTPGGTAQGDLPSEEAHALVLDGAGAANGQSKDILTEEGVNGAVRKIPTSGPLGRQKAATPTNEAGDVGSGGLAARRKATAKRRHSLPVTNLEGGGAWGVPDPTVQDRLRRRRPSFVAADAPLKMLPKEYVEDTATARMLAKQGAHAAILNFPGHGFAPVLLARFSQISRPGPRFVCGSFPISIHLSAPVPRTSPHMNPQPQPTPKHRLSPRPCVASHW